MSKMGRYKSYFTGVQNEGGGQGHLLDNVQKKDAFFMASLRHQVGHQFGSLWVREVLWHPLGPYLTPGAPWPP